MRELGTRAQHSTWVYGIVDLLIIFVIGVLGFGLLAFIEVGNAPFIAALPIDTSPSALPEYALLSTVRSLLALGLSYLVAIAYGTLAARSPAWERILIPALDVLQSLPVLTFMPAFVLGLMSVFPESRWGLEFACILLIFTGQVWNLAFAYYESQRSMSVDLRELTAVLRLSPVRRFLVLDLPNGMRPLIYNGMMSMAGGWFFLTLCESFMLGERNYKLPGLGSYLHESYLAGDTSSFMWGLATLVVLVVGFDFLLWKPLVAWVRRFRDDAQPHEGGLDATTTLVDLWPGLRLPRWFRGLWRRIVPERQGSSGEVSRAGPLSSSESAYEDGRQASEPPAAARSEASPLWVNQWIVTPLGQVVHSSGAMFRTPARGHLFRLLRTWSQWILSFAAGGLVFYLLPRLPDLGQALGRIHKTDWLDLTHALVMTAAKVFGVLFFATLWTVPFGIWVAKRPNMSRFLQPVIQNLAAFPAPVLFPLLTLTWIQWGVSAGWIALALMTIGNQWYLLFNVLSGASRISHEHLEVAKVYRFSLWRRFRFIYLPTIFPSLVTGWITAAGGAWNASIVAEMVRYPGGTMLAEGIGAQITLATMSGDYPRLIAAVVVITIALVILNRTLWHTMHELVERLA